MIKAVVFDLDGTLLNTIEDITDALNFALRNAKLKLHTSDEVKYFVGSGVKELIKRALGEEEDKFNEVYKDYMDYYAKRSRIKTKPYPNIIKMLKRLKAQNYKLAVLSNKPHSDTIEVINYYFPNIFDFVLGHKDSFKIKPAIDGILEVEKTLGVTNTEIAYIGDSDVDNMLANNANVTFIASLWGYRKKAEIGKSRNYANNADDVLEIIAKLNNRFISGIIALDKRSGITSQDAINEVKHALIGQGYYISKIGHAGTLDPLASGLLLVLLNSSTKLSDILINSNKEYLATIILGKHTMELDITGSVTSEREVNATESQIDEVLASFIGKSNQLPPIFSAIKKDGKKMYEYARNGEEVEVLPREIEIFDIKKVSHLEENEFSIITKVSKGTYIRSLARDIGERLNTYGIIKDLRRLSTHDISVSDAYTIEDIKNGNFTCLRDIDCIDLPKFELNDIQFKATQNGQDIMLHLDYPEIVLTYKGEISALYNLNNGVYKAKRVWKSII